MFQYKLYAIISGVPEWLMSSNSLQNITMKSSIERFMYEMGLEQKVKNSASVKFEIRNGDDDKVIMTKSLSGRWKDVK